MFARLIGWTVYVPLIWLSLFWASPVCGADSASAAAGRGREGAVAQKEIGAWIRQLGDEAYAVREAASTKLLSVGDRAGEQLNAAAFDPNPEIRARAARLLVLIEQGRFEERLEAFAADLQGTQGRTLPGWNEFREIVGSDAASRALFVEMQRQEATLLRSAFSDDSQNVETVLAERLERLSPRQQLLGRLPNQRDQAVSPLGSCSALMFVASTSKAEHTDRVSMASAQLAQQPPLRTAVQGGSFEPQVRQLLAHWVVRRDVDNVSLVPQKLSLAAFYQLKGALPLAVGVATGETPWDSIPANVRAMAVLVVGRLAEEQAVEHLEPLLEDDTECARLPAARIQLLRAQDGGDAQLRSVEIRDVALAVLVRQTGQELSAYGIHAEPHDQLLFKLATTGFSSDAARKVALAKWRSWRNGDQKQAEVRGDRAKES